jgi:hypothetical protein
MLSLIIYLLFLDERSRLAPGLQSGPTNACILLKGANHGKKRQNCYDR